MRTIAIIGAVITVLVAYVVVLFRVTRIDDDNERYPADDRRR